MPSPSVSRRWRGEEGRNSTLHGVFSSVRRSSPPGMTAKRTRSAQTSSTNRSSTAWSLESSRVERWAYIRMIVLKMLPYSHIYIYIYMTSFFPHFTFTGGWYCSACCKTFIHSARLRQQPWTREGRCSGLHQQLLAGGQVRGQMGANGQHCSRSGQSQHTQTGGAAWREQGRIKVLQWPWVDLMFLSIFLKPRQGPYLSSRQNADSVKAEIVDYAREKWPMFFSRFFEVVKVSGRQRMFPVSLFWCL